MGWERGAVGNAEWSGVRLKDLLEAAGLRPDAAHVHLLGSDAPPNPKTPAFLRSLPLDRALDPNTIVARRMNSEPLPRLHGGPLRLIVPGWTGNHWLKWLRFLTVANEEAPGFYQQTGYRHPEGSRAARHDGQAGRPGAGDDDERQVTHRPSRREAPSSRRGPVEVRGIAWTGTGLVRHVEVSVDGGPWRLAELEGPEHEGSWRLWTFAWQAKPGQHTLRVRATDSSNQTQPETPPWNKSGYLWNGIDEVHCEVR